MINEEGMPIFTEVIKVHKEIERDSLLKKLHVYVVEKIIAQFGILFGMKVNKDFSNIRIPVDKSYAINFLLTQKKITYNMRTLRTIDLIIDFISLKEDDGQENISISFFTKNFYTIWEIMCRELFKSELKEFDVPRPYWEINGEKKYTKQIPDIVYKEDNILYILDAKYYNIDEGLPGWHDLVKQFFYELSLRKKIIDVQERYNLMVLPYNHGEICSFLGKSKIEDANEFGQIGGVLLDIKMVIKQYCYGNTDNYREIIKKIVIHNDLGNNKYLKDIKK